MDAGSHRPVIRTLYWPLGPRELAGERPAYRLEAIGSRRMFPCDFRVLAEFPCAAAALQKTPQEFGVFLPLP